MKYEQNPWKKIEIPERNENKNYGKQLMTKMEYILLIFWKRLKRGSTNLKKSSMNHL